MNKTLVWISAIVGCLLFWAVFVWLMKLIPIILGVGLVAVAVWLAFTFVKAPKLK